MCLFFLPLWGKGERERGEGGGRGMNIPLPVSLCGISTAKCFNFFGGVAQGEKLWPRDVWCPDSQGTKMADNLICQKQARAGHLFINCGCVKHAFDVLKIFGESPKPVTFSPVKNTSILRSFLDSSGWFKFEA